MLHGDSSIKTGWPVSCSTPLCPPQRKFRHTSCARRTLARPRVVGLAAAVAAVAVRLGESGGGARARRLRAPQHSLALHCHRSLQAHCEPVSVAGHQRLGHPVLTWAMQIRACGSDAGPAGSPCSPMPPTGAWGRSLQRRGTWACRAARQGPAAAAAPSKAAASSASTGARPPPRSPVSGAYTCVAQCFIRHPQLRALTQRNMPMKQGARCCQPAGVEQQWAWIHQVYWPRAPKCSVDDWG